MSGISLSNLIADPLRGHDRLAAYGKVSLPLTVFGGLDCVVAPTKAAALDEKAAPCE
jgi:hypothetical protein